MVEQRQASCRFESYLVDFKKSDAKQQIVFGEVYVPNRRDTDGNFMTAETIEKMAHDGNTDEQIWKSIEAGELTGFSIEVTRELIEEESA